MGYSSSLAIGIPDRSVARIRGLENALCFATGAYARLYAAPASQSETRGNDKERTAIKPRK